MSLLEGDYSSRYICKVLPVVTVCLDSPLLGGDMRICLSGINCVVVMRYVCDGSGVGLCEYSIYQDRHATATSGANIGYYNETRVYVL